MRKKIVNPFDPEKNLCFGCGVNNPYGLRLSFEREKDELIASWDPQSYYQGYLNILHGGIAATILHEASAWYVHSIIGTAGVTTTLSVNYLRPVFLNKGIVTARARLVSKEDKMASFECGLYDGSGTLCVTADTQFFIYPEEVAKRKFSYPGKEHFTI